MRPSVESRCLADRAQRRGRLCGVGSPRGSEAKNISKLRPENAPIFAFTSSEEVYRQLSICWGVYPVKIDFTEDPNATIEAAEKFLRTSKLTAAGDQLVIISDVRAGEERIDSVQLRTAK